MARLAWMHEEAGAELPAPDELLRWWNDREITVTMTASAAVEFLKALDWASAFASRRAEAFRENGNAARAELFHGHAGYLSCGASRVRLAKERQHA